MARIGLTGLGTMGAALALNMADNGFDVAVHNRSNDKVDAFMESAGDLATRLTPAYELNDLVAALEAPRAVIIMVQAGAAVDSVIDELVPLLDKGDLIIDAGNADFNDTRRRTQALEELGLGFLGMGVSGGEEGARHGPSIMVGGKRESFEAIEDIVSAIAAKYRKDPCADWLGPDGAGHFVKTVHNGIEYADMQLIAEVYGLLRAGGRGMGEMAELFADWNEGPLQSYLIEITAKILASRDAETGEPMVDVIVDSAGQKGTGRWTVIEALKLGQSATTIEAAVAARSWSAGKAMRKDAEKAYPHGKDNTAEILDADLETALFAARIIGYGQGMALLAAASEHFDWSLDLARVAEIWRAGCIIRSSLLDDIASAIRAGIPHGQLILAPAFVERLSAGVPALRRVVAASVHHGLPVPALSSALSYFDTVRRGRGTADLIQAQRDYFGRHGFERIDRPGTGFHGPWAE
ncbi:NADP-dependent phosphogluconate dehydrogenase [Silicimonas sp. MF1-12-2]|uniref:NADP-dependent phosphogluconate dehydrogenase n=1 Tax=Silicimonas sp. MF1-12-2 TaxID=3384793 RepID=UPI0039B47906